MSTRSEPLGVGQTSVQCLVRRADHSGLEDFRLPRQKHSELSLIHFRILIECK
jgi:hypothetical protein